MLSRDWRAWQNTIEEEEERAPAAAAGPLSLRGVGLGI